MRGILAALILAVAALAGAVRPAQAAITFEYHNTCTVSCGVINLNPGDAVSAFVSFNDAAILPGATLTEADVVDFTLDFGDVEITYASALAFSFDGVLDLTGAAFDLVLLIASEAIAPAQGDTVLFSLISGFLAGPNGTCPDAACSSLFPTFQAAALGEAAAMVRVQDVPEPASLALFGTALAGLALARRRRTQRTR